MPTRDTPWPQGTPCWVDCPVADVGTARAFYSGLFGWEIHDGPEAAGGYLMALKDGRPAAGLSPQQAGDGAPAAWTTYVAVDDADAVVADVTEAGGRVLMPPMDVMDFGRMAVAADPTGAVFGLWQGGSHAGAGIVGEHGAYCWNELHTRAYGTAQEFYATVFGWTYYEIGDGGSFVYSVFTPSGGDQAVGGVCDDVAMGIPAQVPAHWLTWFAVEDADAATRRVRELGGTVTVEPRDSPFGRMVVVTGTSGELLGLIDPATTVGEPPPPPPS